MSTENTKPERKPPTSRKPRPADPLAPKVEVPAVAAAAPSNPSQTAVDRPPMRPEMRHEMRQEMRGGDSRADADLRAQEILDHLGGNVDTTTDKFWIDPASIPDGWTYEWKRKTVYNKADPAYDVAIARMGWTNVPCSRHPEMMPADWSADTIEREGLILMERPQQITDMVIKQDKKAARDQVRVKEEQLSNAPAPGQLPRSNDPDGDKRTRPTIKKSYEPVQIPE